MVELKSKNKINFNIKKKIKLKYILGNNYLHKWFILFSLYLFLLSMINNIKMYLLLIFY